ncbi:MAG: beta-lactamase family protein [Pirellula sp.]|jgi:CubicO group peptidase (beta-lactamase class C family)|nr:beta-lactamase family protein [Pirellula sp.]
MVATSEIDVPEYTENEEVKSIPVARRRRLGRREFCRTALASTALPFFMKEARGENEESEDLSTALESLRKKGNLPGLIAGHFTLQGETTLGAVGYRKAGSDDALQVDDPMHLGSCTKSMTATLFGMLIDEGRVSMDTTLGEVFQDDRKVTESSWSETSMRQLIQHTSGAMANPPWNDFATPDADVVDLRRDIMHWLVQRKRPSETVGKFTYSNLGYTVLGHVIEHLRGHSWEHEITSRLFEPLGMTSAGFGPPSKTKPDQSPWGHNRVFGFSVATEQDNPPALGPAGTVHASMADWIKYLRVHLTKDPQDLPIKGTTLEQLHRPSQGENYAGGWGCGEREWAGGRILTHNGSNTHWYCVVFLALEQQRGVLAASNIGLSAVQTCDEALQWMIRRHSQG